MNAFAYGTRSLKAVGQICINMEWYFDKYLIQWPFHWMSYNIAYWQFLASQAEDDNYK